MQCIHHPEAAATARCAACAEPFCHTCLVEVSGNRYCGACKQTAVTRIPVAISRLHLCGEAKSALVCSLVGIFFFSFILGPAAIIMGVKARKAVQQDARLTGSGLAAAAIVIGSVITLLAILNLYAMSQR